MAKTAKKTKTKDHLPKRVAGVKVPKRLRRGRVGKFLASPEGEAMVIGLVAAAGQRFVKKGEVGRKARSLISHPVDSLKAAGGKAGRAGSHAAHDAGALSTAFAFALGEAGRRFAEALAKGPDRAPTTDDPKTAFPGEAAREEPAAKTEKKGRDDAIAH